MKKNWTKLFLGAALIAPTSASLAASTVAPANSSATSTARIPKKLQPLDTNKFHFILNLETSSNMYREDSVDRQATTDLLFGPSYKFSELYSVAAKSILSKQSTGPRNTTISNTSMALIRKGMELGPNASLSHSLVAVVPTNEEAKTRDRLQGAIAISSGVKFNFLNVQSEYSLLVLRNFHEYTVNAENSPNVQYTLRHDLSFLIALFSRFSLVPAGYYKSGWTYENYDRNSYGLGLDLLFKANKEFAVYVGSGNEGPAYKANGTESNIKAYDQNTSVLRAGLSYTY